MTVSPAPSRDLIDLARRLLQTPSPSGREGAAADVFAEGLENLGYDRVYRDDAGNVIGEVSRGRGPLVLFNGHLDVVPAGPEELWPHPPYGGVVADGHLWGRGACDMKAALACMAFAGKEVAAAEFAGTLLVTAVVQEEIGGVGARYLGRRVAPDVVILGEPSSLRLMLGHRGRVELLARLPGTLAHAARPARGENALMRAAAFLQALGALDLPQGGPLGGSTATPTNLRSFPEESANVVPGLAELLIDYRNIPDDEPGQVLERLRALDPDAQIDIPFEEAVTETGRVREKYRRIAPAYLAPGENPLVERSRDVLRRLLPELGVPFEEGVWWFATDAPHLAVSGAPVIGLGPGDENLAHTSEERVPLHHLAVATAAYRDLAMAYLAGRRTP